MRTLSTLLCTAFALALLCPLASAEKKDRHRNDKQQAELRIRAVIVPAVFPPRHKGGDHDRDDARVIYNLSPLAEQFTVTEETRSMLVDDLRHEQVQLTTVVLK
jgi:hypothetical protein